MTTSTPPHRPHRFLVGFSGELSLKNKGTRKRFVDRLVSNLAEALRTHGVPCDIERSWSRLLLHAPSPEAAEVALRVFGVQSVTAITCRTWQTLEDILQQGEVVLAPYVEGKTFAVKARRGEAAQKVPFKSPDIERRLGSRLLPGSAGVDLSHPQAPVTVEIHGDEVYFGGVRRLAEGGLPIGTEGKALALVSGGFDSVVAAWKVLRRGVRLDYLFLNLGGDAHRDSVLRVLAVLADRWSYGYRPRLHMVDFRAQAEEIRQRCPRKLWQIVLKRQMLRLADSMARMHGLSAIVTGDVIGQVSSQTLQNLAVISAATPLPVLRPLLTEAKEDIVAMARRIGTHDASSKVPEYCDLAGKSPETHAKPSWVDEAEEALDVEALRRAAEERTTVDLRAFDLEMTQASRREVEEIPPGAVVIDLRSLHAYRSWHFPGAEHMSYGDAVRDLSAFEPGTTYVFYCEVGLKSAHLAELLGRRGIDRAHHVGGGLKRVLRLAEGDDPALEALRSPVLLD